MTADEALIPATEIPGPVLEPLLPRGFEPGSTAQVIDGIPAWFAFHGDDCDFNDLYVHSHDERRALEVVARMADEFDAPGDQPEIVKSGWCLLLTECGCTPERHEGHADLDAGCEGDCDHPELAPCNSEPLYIWMLEEIAADTSGALPFLRVALS